MHEQLIAEGRVQPLTFKQLRSIERIDARKSKRKDETELAQTAVRTFGDVATSGLTAVAAFSTGPGGYVLALLVVHYLEKIATYTTKQSPGAPGGWYIVDPNTGNPVGGPYPSWSTAHDAYASGPFQQVQNLTGVIFDIEQRAPQPPEYSSQGLLSTDEAELAKTLLTAAAASGVAGNLLGGLFGRR